jgi:tetratricopeptide (TPR) repeat protein
VFAREVNENVAMIASLEDAILFNVDCEKGEGPEIAKKYKVRGYPTYIAMDGEGEITDSWIGYEGADVWAAQVIAAKADRRTIVAKKAAYEAEPTLALAKALASHTATSAEYKNAVDYYSKALELDPDNARDYNQQILMSMLYGLEGGDFTIEEVLAKAEPAMASDETTVLEKLELAMMMKYMTERSGNLDAAVPFIAAAMAASEGNTDEEVVKYRDYMAVDHALLVEKDTPKALELFRNGMPEGWEEDSGRLNQFAWWCFENEINLEEAQTLALKGVTLAEDGVEKAQILDTAAEICNALGNCDEAVDHIKLALELDPDNSNLKDQLARFETAVKEKNEG